MSNYLNLFLDAGMTRDQERYTRCLDQVLAEEGIGVEEVMGVGEKDEALCVVHRKGVALAEERGVFNRRVEVQRVGPLAPVTRLRKEIEGFKGRGGLSILAYDASGRPLWKINWGLGGPDWVVPMVERQSDYLFRLLSDAMDSSSEAPARPSVATAPSKTGALLDWATDVVKAAGVEVTDERVAEHANMAAASISRFGFLKLGAPIGIDDLNEFYPGGHMPDGTPLATFDDLCAHVAGRIGSSEMVDQEIDRWLASAWSDFVNGCRDTYAPAG